PSPYPAAAGPRPLSAARSSGQDHLDRPHDAEILIAAIGDDERAAAQQSLSGLLLNEGRRDAVDHAALQREVSAAAQPLAALWILETEHRPREFGNVDAIEMHLRMRRGGETGLAAGLLIGVENFALGHAGAHQLHHLAADELHRLEHLDMQRLWLAEHHDLIGVTAIVAIMAMRRHRADIAVFHPPIETEFGEERILRRFLAEIELEGRIEIAAGIPHGLSAFLHDLAAQHAGAARRPHALDRGVENAVRPVKDRDLLVALQSSDVVENIRYVDDLERGQLGVEDPVCLMADAAGDADCAAFELQLLEALDERARITAGSNVAHPALRILDDVDGDVGEIAPGENGGERLLGARRQQSKHLAGQRIAEIEQIGARDDRGVDAALGELLAHRPIAAVALGERESGRFFQIGKSAAWSG